MVVPTLRGVDRGDVVLITAIFRTSAGILADPGAVTFQVRKRGSQVNYAFPDASQVTRPSAQYVQTLIAEGDLNLGEESVALTAGVYVLTLPITVDRAHDVRVVGTGTIAAAAFGRIVVRDDGFTA